ncbi:hypothetical protein ZWY2020_000263 [Hordeum vulgare]|nr:hypothetical protein ZWY2020_000263 [Hordeum vulgare]
MDEEKFVVPFRHRRKFSMYLCAPPLALSPSAPPPPPLHGPSVNPWTMEMNTATSLEPRAKATLVLGGEPFAVSSESGTLSEQLAVMREKSMVILKEYITKHNVPNDVPDESIEGPSDEEGEALAKNPPKKSKKQK